MNIIIKKTNKIEGEIKISGSKNAALPILASCILLDSDVVLKNIPNIKDIELMIDILKEIGVKIELKYNKNNEYDFIVIKKVKKIKQKLLSDFTKFRGSYYVLAALIAIKKKVKAYYPGGCNLGERPIDFHIDGFEKMNIKTEIEDYIIHLRRKRIKPTTIFLKQKSVGATINMIIISVKNKGQTIINNASVEPEVLDFINFLNKANANIKVKDNRIEINGTKKLEINEYFVMYDRIECASYIMLASIFKNNKLIINNGQSKYLKEVIRILRKMNIDISVNVEKNILIVSRKNDINGVNIIANNYPGFPTDLQQIIASVLLLAKTESSIKDKIFPKRINHIEELKKLNAKIIIKDNEYIINPSKIYLTNNVILNGIDLRGTFALIVASLIALKNSSDNSYIKIKNVDNLFRGYENILEKLKKIGINILLVGNS